jgi:HD-like signal output (HDOD) protein
VELLVQPPAGVAERARKGLGNLPPFSSILSKLAASLAQEDFSFNEIAGLIEKDAVLAGNVLRLVNSAMYGRRGTVNSVRHAVSIIGAVRLRNFVMSLSLNQIWHRIPVAEHWSHAQFALHGVATAILADLLAQHVDCDYPEGAFAGGLLLNIGSLLVAVSMPGESEQVRVLYIESSRTDSPYSVEDCEFAVLGADHAEFSAIAVEYWKLPTPIQKAVAGHTRAVRDGHPASLAWLLRIAEGLAEQLDIPLQPWVAPPTATAPESLVELGLEAQSAKILEGFETEFSAIRPFFH